MKSPAGRPLRDERLIEELKAIRMIVDDLLARAQGIPPVDGTPPAACPPALKVRIAAARVRVSSDRQVGRITPTWISNLARQGQSDRT